MVWSSWDTCKGNIYGNQIYDLDGDGTTLDSCGGSYKTPYDKYFVTGNTLPDTWSHNGKSGGIYNLVGNGFTNILGLEIRGNGIYTYAENNKDYVYTGLTIIGNSASPIVDLTNTSQDILNEGIANTYSTDGYVPSNLDGDYVWFSRYNNQVCGRGGCAAHSSGKYYGPSSGLWPLCLEINTFGNWYQFYRLTRKI